MIRDRGDGTSDITWTCTNTDCSKCLGYNCKYFSLTVSTKEDVSDLSPESDCKYGDTVKLKVVIGNNGFGLLEIPIVGKSGKLPFIKINILHILHNNVFTLYIT